MWWCKRPQASVQFFCWQGLHRIAPSSTQLEVTGSNPVASTPRHPLPDKASGCFSLSGLFVAASVRAAYRSRLKIAIPWSGTSNNIDWGERRGSICRLRETKKGQR
jgi:hypothetical protein